MKFSIKNVLNKCDQIRCFLRIWSHLVKKSLMENFIFCAVSEEERQNELSDRLCKIYIFQNAFFMHLKTFVGFWKSNLNCYKCYKAVFL